MLGEEVVVVAVAGGVIRVDGVAVPVLPAPEEQVRGEVPAQLRVVDPVVGQVLNSNQTDGPYSLDCNCYVGNLYVTVVIS